MAKGACELFTHIIFAKLSCQRAAFFAPTCVLTSRRAPEDLKSLGVPHDRPHLEPSDSSQQRETPLRKQ